MLVLFALTIIGWLKPIKLLTEAAPLTEFVQKSRNLWGFPHSEEIVLKRHDRDNDAIVFDGPTNEKPVLFPGDEDVIDLSGSFTPTMTFSPMPKPLTPSSSVAYANCGAFSQNGVIAAVASNATILTYPNGTQVLYSKCEVVQTIDDAG